MGGQGVIQIIIIIQLPENKVCAKYECFTKLMRIVLETSIDLIPVSD